MSDSEQPAGKRKPSSSTDAYRLTSRDAGLCAVIAALYALPWVSQLLREAATAVGVLLSSVGPAAIAIILVPVGIAGYFVRRARISWGWKTAAVCAILVLWLVVCKALLVGQVGLGIRVSPGSLITPVAAGMVTVGIFRWGRDRHLPFLACAIGLASAVLALRQLFYGPVMSDVYLFQQGLWTTWHGGGLFHVSDEGGSHFGTHWSPALFLLVPVYAVWPSPVPLIITQSAALAAAAFPVHALLRRAWPEGEALALTTGFLLLPSLLGSTLWQYHEVAYGLAAFLAALLYFERRRTLPFALFSLVALLVKETFVVPVALFAVYAAGQRRGWRWIVLPAIGAAVYGALAFGVIMPRFHNQESDRPFRSLYGYLGDSPRAAARYLVTHPSRAARLLTRGRNRSYLETISAPTGHVLSLGGAPVIFAIPDAAAVLLARPSPWPVRDPTSHYSMLIAAVLVIAFAYAARGAARRARTSRTPMAVAAGLLFMAAATQGAAAVARYTGVLPREAIAARRQIVRLVPADASIVVTWAAAPYLANRRHIYQEREGTLESVRADYYLTYHHVETPRERAGLTAKGWELVAEKSGFSLWKRVRRGQAAAGS